MKVKKSDVWKVCAAAGLTKCTRKFYDAPPETEYRLYDSVGAALMEVCCWEEIVKGEPVLVVKYGQRRVTLRTYKDLEDLAKMMRLGVESYQKMLIATPADDAKVWKWLGRNLILTKWDLKNGTVTYGATKDVILLYGEGVSLTWCPMTNGSESRSIAGSDTAPLGEIGYNTKTFPAWLEAQGIKKAKKRDRY